MVTSRFALREAGLLLGGVILLAACAGIRQPPTSADTRFSVLIYNRTLAPVFVLGQDIPACDSSRITATAMRTQEAATPPPGVAPFTGAIKITTPRGYAGTVSVVIAAAGSASVSLGDIPASSLPACQNPPWG
ncbi:MAG TPA: hypothetical protein VF763_08880 [Candidatus Limnocylindrales bacterium]